jgi:hypothetical protein
MSDHPCELGLFCTVSACIIIVNIICFLGDQRNIVRQSHDTYDLLPRKSVLLIKSPEIRLAGTGALPVELWGRIIEEVVEDAFTGGYKYFPRSYIMRQALTNRLVCRKSSVPAVWLRTNH